MAEQMTLLSWLDEVERTPPGILLQISLPYICAGVVVGERAAPVLSAMTGGNISRWPLERIEAYCARRKWACEVVAPATPPPPPG